MAEFLGTPKVQYFDTATGQPLSGGKLYTYEPGVGSTTDKATYPTIADALAATNANTNPVILDSRGEADVVLSGSTKLVLKTSADVTIWTVDAVGATGNSIIDPSGNEILIVSYVADAVNEITITNAATGDSPSINATGGDTNINLIVNPKGTGGIDIGAKIIDVNENEQLTFTKVDSAVNYLDISNSITTASPIISAKGDDTNIGVTITPKGSGKVKLGVLNMPIADGTANQVMTTDGSAQLQFVGAQTFSSSAKAWVKCGVTGNIFTSFNVTSVTDAAVGRILVTYTTAFASVSYVSLVSVQHTAASIPVINTPNTTQTSFINFNDSGSEIDPGTWAVACFGTQ